MSLLRNAILRKPWSPHVIRGDLALWLDAADPGVFTIETGVSQWRDKSPRGALCNQATGGNQPALVAGALNGLPGVRFVAAGRWLSGGLVLAGSTMSWATVGMMTSSTLSNGRAIGLAPTGGGDITTTGFSPLSRSSTIETIRTAWNAGARNLQAITYTVPFIYVVVWTSAGADAYFNGGAAVNIALAPSISVNNYTVGNNRSGGTTGSSFWDGDIYETLGAQVSWDTDTRQRIEGYAAHKWGIRSSLDAAHPYLLTPP